MWVLAINLNPVEEQSLLLIASSPTSGFNFIYVCMCMSVNVFHVCMSAHVSQKRASELNKGSYELPNMGAET